jgi:hypothetical protein
LGQAIDKNPTTLAFSVFLGLWSTLFLELWQRRECELRCVWGAEGFEEKERPRAGFIGELKRNPITRREVLGHIRREARLRALRKLVGNLVGFLSCCLIILLSYMCYQIRTYQTPYDDKDYATDGYIIQIDDNGEDGERHTPGPIGKFWMMNDYKMASALASVAVIFVAEQTYKRLAKVMVEWENFRTETERQDALIQKTVLFEFVNNYFALFYMAFLIQIQPNPAKRRTCTFVPDRVTTCGTGACFFPGTDRSCMSEMMVQLLVVFSFKTLFKKLVELVKPFARAKCKMVAKKAGVASTERDEAFQRQKQGPQTHPHITVVSSELTAERARFGTAGSQEAARVQINLTEVVGLRRSEVATAYAVVTVADCKPQRTATVPGHSAVGSAEQIHYCPRPPGVVKRP